MTADAVARHVQHMRRMVSAAADGLAASGAMEDGASAGAGAAAAATGASGGASGGAVVFGPGDTQAGAVYSPPTDWRVQGSVQQQQSLQQQSLQQQPTADHDLSWV
jgi:hypothetical protein